MIVDCFAFFNELDLLEVRLNELKDVVDLFVITESPLTFTRLKKPLYLQENLDRFSEFNILPLVYRSNARMSPHMYEVRQKQWGINQATSRMRKGDIIILGDADEIPKASVVKEALGDEWRSCRLAMPIFYYYMNCKGTTEKTLRTSRMIRYNGRRIKYRMNQRDEVDRVYEDAGWDFSWLGDVQEKLRSWTHAVELNKPPYNQEWYIEKCREEGKDLFNRRGKRAITFEFLENLDYLPEYVLQNMDKFGKYIKK